MNFNYKNPITPLTSLGNQSVPRKSVYGTNFSILGTGGYMEVYSLNDLYFTIPSGSTGLVEFSANTIPIQFNKGTGSVFSPDVLTLNSDNISSGRRRIGMLVYVIDVDQIYQYQIPNFESLWSGATGATGPGGNTVIFSEFGTTIKNNSPEGIAFISAWTSNIIEGVSGGTSSNAAWKKFVTGGGTFTGNYLPLSGGTVTGDTIFTSGLTATTFSASTYLGLPIDVYVTGGTYSAGTATFTNNTGGTFNISGFYTGGTDYYVTGGTFDKNTETLTLNRNDGNSVIITGFTDVFVTGGTYSAGTITFVNNTGGTFNVNGLISADTYTTGFTFNPSNYDLTIKRNDGVNLTTNLSILASDVTITGGTYDPNTGTATFTNNTGGTFNVTGFLTGFTDIYVTGGTFDKNSETLTLQRTDGNSVTITGFTDIFVTGGTYSAGTATFTNNTGGTFNVTGFYTGGTDYYVTGGTFDKNTETLTLNRNDGNNIDISGFTDVFVTGGTYSNGTLYLTNNSGYTFTVPGFSTATGGTSNYYGSFYDTTTQVVSGSNTPTLWTYNTTYLSNGIYIQDGSKIKVSNSGIYEIGYSAQMRKTQGGSSADVTIWASINGSPVTDTSSTTSFEANNSFALPFVSYIFELNAGDYVEFYFSSPNSSVEIATLSGLTSPTRPVSPSVIVLAKAIGNAVLNTSGDSFVTGFTLSGSNLILQQNRVGMFSGFSVNLPFLPLTGGTLTGPLSATTYYGDGSNLTGLSRGGGGGAGGQLYYFNISNTQTPYYEFSTTATTASEKTISASTGSLSTVLIGGFMTPSGVPNITNFPAGILSFYLHTYDGGTNHNFNIYCELYKRTTGGTETKLFTSAPSAVIGSTVQMVISDGFFSGTTLNTSDRLVVKVYGQNISNQTRTIYFVSEDSANYSFALTTIPAYTDTYVTGFTYNNNVLTIKQNNNQPDLTATINSVTGWTVNGNLIVTGNTSLQGLTATTISASTYQNLPIDVYVTGGTKSGSVITFTNNTGGTFTVTGITDTFVTGGTYSNGTATFTNNTGGTFNVTGFYTGGTDYFVTGGTFDKNTETLTLNRNDGNSVVITGFTDIFVTGGTYSGNTITFTNNTGGTFTVTGITSGGETFTGGTVSGATVFTNGLSANTFNLTTTPTNNNSNVQILSRNSVTGEIEYVDVNSILVFDYGLAYALSNGNFQT